MDEQSVSAEGFDLQSDLFQDIRVFFGQGGFGRVEMDSLGDKELLSFQGAGECLSADFFVKDTFVEGMLIDDYHAFLILGDQIPIVNLDGMLASAR